MVCRYQVRRRLEAVQLGPRRTLQSSAGGSSLHQVSPQTTSHPDTLSSLVLTFPMYVDTVCHSDALHSASSSTPMVSAL